MLAARSVTPIRTVQAIAIFLLLAVAAIFAADRRAGWIGKASPLVVSVVVCGGALIASAAGLWTFWVRTVK